MYHNSQMRGGRGLKVTWSYANVNDNILIKRANNDSVNRVTQIRGVSYTFTQILKVTVGAVTENRCA